MATKTLARGMGTFFKSCEHPSTRWSKCPHPYTIRYRDVTGRQREETGFATQDKATTRLSAIHQTKQGAQKVGPTAGEKVRDQRLEDFATSWIGHRSRGLASQSADSYQSALQIHIIPRLGSRRVGTFTADVVDDFVADMAIDGIGPAAQSTAYKVLRLVLNSARHRGGLPLDPFLDSTAPEYQRKDVLIPSLDEIELMRLHADVDLRLAIELMVGCGLRNGEANAANINWVVADDVYRVNNQIHARTRIPAPLKHRKWGEFREVPFPGTTREFMLKYGTEHPSDKGGYLLTNGGRGGSGGGGSAYYSGNAFRYKWRKCLDSAEIKTPYTMYSLRHYFASNCLSRGIPITDVAEWMGHRSIEVTYRIYRHLMPSSIGRAAKILDGGL